GRSQSPLQAADLVRSEEFSEKSRCPYDEADARHWISQQAGRWDYVIRAGGRLVGSVSTTGAELGYWLAAPERGRGLATGAARLAVMRWFAAGYSTLTARYEIGNDGSAALLHRLGFRDAGSEQRPSAARGKLVARAIQTLTPRDFAAANPFRIATARTIMDPLLPGDAEALAAIVSLPEVARMLFLFDSGFGPDRARDFIRDWSWQGAPPFRLAIRTGGRMIGSIGIGAPPENEIYYFLAPEVGGRGLASEIVPAFCEAVTARFDLRHLTAEVFDDNPASIRVLERAGFRRTGPEMLHSRGRAEPAPGWAYRRDSEFF
ncbi:GNAT family N-acetyltransferase, partial [Paracoccus pacificus]